MQLRHLCQGDCMSLVRQHLWIGRTRMGTPAFSTSRVTGARTQVMQVQDGFQSGAVLELTLTSFPSTLLWHAAPVAEAVGRLSATEGRHRFLRGVLLLLLTVCRQSKEGQPSHQKTQSSCSRDLWWPQQIGFLIHMHAISTNFTRQKRARTPWVSQLGSTMECPTSVLKTLLLLLD